MKATEILDLNQKLQRLYGDRYAGMTNEMGMLWYAKLKTFSLEVGLQAIDRWATAHLLHQLPALDDLIVLMEVIQREQRAAQRPQPQGHYHGLTEEELLELREHELSQDKVHELVQELFATIDAKGAAYQAWKREQRQARNPANPTRWLPLNEEFLPEPAPQVDMWSVQPMSPLGDAGTPSHPHTQEERP